MRVGFETRDLHSRQRNRPLSPLNSLSHHKAAGNGRVPPLARPVLCHLRVNYMRQPRSLKENGCLDAGLVVRTCQFFWDDPCQPEVREWEQKRLPYGRSTITRVAMPLKLQFAHSRLPGRNTEGQPPASNSHNRTHAANPANGNATPFAPVGNAAWPAAHHQRPTRMKSNADHPVAHEKVPLLDEW